MFVFQFSAEGRSAVEGEIAVGGVEAFSFESKVYKGAMFEDGEQNGEDVGVVSVVSFGVEGFDVERDFEQSGSSSSSVGVFHIQSFLTDII